MEDDFKNIVSTDWLAQHLEAPDIRIIAVSYTHLRAHETV